MAVESVATLVEMLRRNRLLEPLPLHELTTLGLQDRFTDPHSLAQEMVQRRWLTAYQVHELFEGRDSGLVLGSYVIQEKLGEGPLGASYKARHVHMRRVVTLNVIREELLAEPAAVERFYREIQLASQLSSPNILHAYDAGPVGRTHFFAMEYVQGTDLGQLVQEGGPLPVERACAYILQATLGLQHAFEKGLLHRDIKPANLVVVGADSSGSTTAEVHPLAVHGVVKIRNFGLSLLQPSSPGGSGEVVWAEDTADFLAPERGDGANPGDVRSDLYSLGGVFYYLLSGQLPYPGGRPAEKVRRHREEEPVPIDLLVADLPSDVLVILQHLLAKDPNDRIPTPAQLAEALAVLLGVDLNSARNLAQPPRSDVFVPPPPGQGLEDLAQTVSAPVRRQRPRSRGLFLLNMGIAAMVVAVVGILIAVVWRERPGQSSSSGAGQQSAEDRARAAFQALSTRARQPHGSVAELREQWRAFWLEHPGSDLRVKAAFQLGQLPSPLDELNAGAIPAVQISQPEPEGLVAVVGDGRLRHWAAVTCLAFQPDGGRVFSGGSDGVVRIWDAESLGEVGAIPGLGVEVSGVACSADGRQLATTGNDNTVRLWELDRRPVQKVSLRVPNTQSAVALSPDGRLLAVGSADRTDRSVRLWKQPATADAKPVILTGHTAEVRALAFAPDNATLASASNDKTVRLWDLGQAMPVVKATLEHGQPVVAVAFSPDGRVLAAAAGNKVVRLWDVATGQAHEPGQLAGHTTDVNAVAFHRDGSWLAAGARDGTIRLWSWNQGQPQGSGVVLRGHRDAVRALAFAADKPVLASGANDQSVRLWDLTAEGGQPRGSLTDWPMRIHALAVTSDNQTMVFAGSDGNLRLWQMADGRLAERAVLPAATQLINALAFNPAGVLLAAACRDKKVRLWKRLGDRLEAGPTLDAHNDQVTQVCFSPDGKQLASVSTDRTVAVWQLGELEARPQMLSGATRELRAVSFAADSKLLAAGGADAVVHVWTTASDDTQPSTALATANGGTSFLDFAPHGTPLAIAGLDTKVHLWDLAGGEAKAVKVLEGHKSALAVVRFALDNRSLVSAGINGHIIWWDMPGGRRKNEWQLSGGLQTLALAADSRHLITANNNGTVYVIRLAPPGPR